MKESNMHEHDRDKKKKKIVKVDEGDSWMLLPDMSSV